MDVRPAVPDCDGRGALSSPHSARIETSAPAVVFESDRSARPSSARTEHGVSVKAVREAARFAERKLQINRLLLSPELRTKAGDIFLDRYGELINLSASGQLAMRHVLDAHLKRVVWENKLPIRLHPFVTAQAIETAMPIAIDPRIAFGRPVVVSRGVSTAAIVGRIDAGESPADVAADYKLSQEEVEDAVLYERAA